MFASIMTSVFAQAAIGTLIWIQPIVDKDEFPVGFRFIAQAVFRARPGGLEGNLLPTLTVQAVAGAKISVEFKGANLFLQLRDLDVCFSKKVIGRFLGSWPWNLPSDLIGVSDDAFAACSAASVGC